MRCLQCKDAPCSQGCPVHVHIPDFINQIVEGDALKAADVLLRVSRWKNKLKHHRFDRKKECTEPMKKSCLIAVITALAAVAGALAAVAVYLHRREKELDEYERLLFGEDTAAPALEKFFNEHL